MGIRSNDNSPSQKSESSLPDQTHNLGQIQGIIPNGIEDQILKLVHCHEQILAQRCHDVELKAGTLRRRGKS